MVTELETFAKQYRKAGFRGFADDLIDVGKKHPELPKRLDIERATEENPTIKFNLGESAVMVGGTKVPLSPTECHLFLCLFRNPNRVVTDENLIKWVWGENGLATKDKLRVAMSRLRAKIERNKHRVLKYIIRRNGLGYVFLGYNETAEDEDKEGAGEVSNTKEIVYEHFGFKFFPERNQVVVGVETIKLTPKERKLLILFVHNIGRTLTKDTLINFAWNQDGTDDDLRVYINRLRSKIGWGYKDGQQKYIRTIRCLGYRMVDPNQPGM